jgi:hypothetical protein
LSKELFVVLNFEFWFWFLSYCFLSLFVLGSFGYHHNNWRPPFVFGSSNKPRMSTRKKRTTANSTKGASSSLNEEPNLSTLLTQGEALPESGAAHEAELAKLRKEAEELARTKKRLLAIQHEAEIQKQKAEIASLKEELRALKAKQSLSFNQPSPEYTVSNQSNFNECTEFFTQPPPHNTFSRNPFVSPFESGLRTRTFIPFTRDLGIPNPPCLKKFRSLHGHKRTCQSHYPDSRANPTQGNS